MHSAIVSTHLRPAEIDAVQHFVDRREAALGFRPISDQAWAELSHGPVGRMLAVRVREKSGAIAAYAQAVAPSPRVPPDPSPDALRPDRSWTVEIAFDTDDPVRITRLATHALAATVQAVLQTGGTDLTWVVQAPTAAHERAAATFGLMPTRRLHQMRRALPTGMPVMIETRPFDAERDLDEWVRVNNRAFAWNPEQGSWTTANVLARMDERWFDPKGFLIHERDGRMAGFCWTKIHLAPVDAAASATPPIGEIYVIAVDPDFHGLGLGHALTLAGLQSLADRGVIVGMLFVDADNENAVRLYDKLGFVVSRTDCIYTGQLRDPSTPVLPAPPTRDPH
ncbi:MAG: mshD [Ilumatobacteraceae bacterium]|nr:mshD [Ilumatobacteraceae bacterium]